MLLKTTKPNCRFTARKKLKTLLPHRSPLIVLGSLVSLSLFSFASYGTSFQQLKNIEVAKIEQGIKTQQQIDALDDERLQLSHQYRVALNQNTQLEKYNENLKNIIVSQEKEAEILREQINRVGSLEKNIIPLMSDMIDALENFIELDQPFLIEKRRQRVAKLRHLFNDSNVSNAEKYRRVLEAYQIENDYGLTIESYEGTVNSTMADNQRVNFLKIGRIAFMYQTVDGKQSFRWSKDNKNWQLLDKKFNAEITKGIQMSQEKISSNLLLIPVISQ